MRVVRIEPVVGTLIAESKDEAKEIRIREILPALAAGDSVSLDFAAVGFVTQSYIHALIAEAIRRYGEDIFERIEFKSCTDEVKQVILTVFEYTMAAADAAADLDVK